MPIFKNARRFSLFLCLVCFFMYAGNLWAMSEGRYAQMAAENLRVMHEAKGDAKEVVKASEEFLQKFSQEEINEYIEMAHRVMQDEALAKRVSQKVIDQLSQMGYKVKATLGADINAITIEDK